MDAIPLEVSSAFCSHSGGRFPNPCALHYPISGENNPVLLLAVLDAITCHSESARVEFTKGDQPGVRLAKPKGKKENEMRIRLRGQRKVALQRNGVAGPPVPWRHMTAID